MSNSRRNDYRESRENWRSVYMVPLNVRREWTDTSQNLSMLRTPPPINPPRFSEQVLFTQDMMKKPIKDVLNYYYRLRELDQEYTSHFQQSKSKDRVSLLKEVLRDKMLSSCERVIDPVEIIEQISQSSTDVESPESTEETDKMLTDCQTQVRYGEDGLRSYVSSETIELGFPKTDKVNPNQFLSPLYLFGNNSSGWSSNPSDAIGKCKLRSRSDTHTENRLRTTPTKPEKPSCSSFQGRTAAGGTCFRSTLPRFQPSGSLCPTTPSSQEVPVQEEGESVCSEESDESFSLFYSKTADLTSPLLDMSRFIFPDHIHYSYKNVKKKGFDVEFNGGLPILMRESLTLNSPLTVKMADIPSDPQTGITRRPMDLTFARSGYFTGKNGEKPSTSRAGEEKVSENSQVNTGHAPAGKKEMNCSIPGRRDRCIRQSLENDASSTEMTRATTMRKHTKKNRLNRIRLKYVTGSS
ncbi:UNVERIFIED_CONTAM: hypothetical protein PYX00_000399 [Menopon gallinae]|uniref:Uncharacterized protein n=1 Tax=Menopon gallinae TaxID=328185 RepID=A0AAW2I9T7_9NEOP